MITNLDWMNMSGGEQHMKIWKQGCLQSGLLVHTLWFSILLEITKTEVVANHLNTSMLTCTINNYYFNLVPIHSFHKFNILCMRLCHCAGFAEQPILEKKPYYG